MIRSAIPRRRRARRDWVIDRMLDAGFITPAQANAAKAAPIVIRRRSDTALVQAPYFTEEVRRELLARFGEKALYESGLAVRTSLDPALQAVADRALRGALIAYDRRHGYRGPIAHIDARGDWRARLAALPLPAGAADVGWRLALVLGTTPSGAAIGLADGTRGAIPYEELRWARRMLDDGGVGPVPASAAQALAVGDVVLVGQPAESDGKPRGGEPLYSLCQIPEVSGALVALDPHTGRVLADSGGFSYEISQFDRVTQAYRQTGSAIKPFIYLAALDHGFTPSTIVVDGPLVVDQGPGLPKWNPTNYEHKFYGPVPLRVGLEESLNLVTARVGITIGIDTVAQYIERFGIIDHMPKEDAFILGAGETTPLRLATAYAMLDNGGKRITPTYIDRVQDRNGQTIYRADSRSCEECSGVAWTGQAPPELPDAREQIADPRSAYQIVSMMEGVTQRGTGRSLANFGKPLAGKTGTTNEFKDTWFMGFSPDLVAGVYVGFDTPRSLGKRETGAAVALPAFRAFMEAALKDKPAIPFRIPPGIRLVRVNPATGRLAGAGDRNVIWEAFKPGTEPGAGVAGRGGDRQQRRSATQADDGATPAAAAAPDGPASPQTAPASGTGGLY